MKVVIVTYNWPPRNAIGTHRPYAWAKAFARAGDSVTVITAAKYAFDEPLDLLLPDLPKVNVIEVPYFSKGVFTVRVLARIRRSRLLRRLKQYIAPELQRAADVRSGWVAPATQHARLAAETADVVISTYGPAASHIIASCMKAWNPDLFWVADFRDLWSANHFLYGGRVRDNALLRLETATLASADLLTTVSEELRISLTELHSKPCLVVENGYDSDPTAIKPQGQSRPPNARRRTLRIVYTGAVYAGRQDPTPLFEAISALQTKGVIKLGEVVVEFYGGRNQELQESIPTHFRPFVRFLGHVPRDEAVRAQREADFLLLLEKPGASNRGVVTGKIFEYIISGTPILSLGSDEDSAIGRILSSTGCGICLGEDRASIAGVLEKFFSSEGQDWFKPNSSVIQRYSRSSQAETFRAKLCEMVSADLPNRQGPPV